MFYLVLFLILISKYWLPYKLIKYTDAERDCNGACLVLDDEDGDAAGARGHRATGGEAAPVPAVLKVILQQPPTRAAHTVS